MKPTSPIPMSETSMADSRPRLEPEHVYALFHLLLFAYQRNYRDILLNGDAIFLQPVLDLLNDVLKDSDDNFDFLSEFLAFNDKFLDTDEVLSRFGTTIQSSGFAEKVSVTGKGRVFDLKIDGCVLNPECNVHKRLKPKDVTCPWGLLGMLIFQHKTGLEVHPEDTVYSEDSAQTIIRAKDQ